jgi:hypothetical protein
MSRRAKTYEGPLSRPSKPRLTVPSQNGLRDWRRKKREHWQRGLDLLYEYYELPKSSLYAEEWRLRQLVFALARDHVPYFREKKVKTSRWDAHVKAKFLRDTHTELKKGTGLDIALGRAHDKLPAGIRGATVESLKRRYRAIRMTFASHVKVGPDHSLVPYGEYAWLFPFLIEDPSSDGTHYRRMPDPDDPDAIMLEEI